MGLDCPQLWGPMHWRPFNSSRGLCPCPSPPPLSQSRLSPDIAQCPWDSKMAIGWEQLTKLVVVKVWPVCHSGLFILLKAPKAITDLHHFADEEAEAQVNRGLGSGPTAGASQGKSLPICLSGGPHKPLYPASPRCHLPSPVLAPLPSSWCSHPGGSSTERHLPDSDCHTSASSSGCAPGLWGEGTPLLPHAGPGSCSCAPVTGCPFLGWGSVEGLLLQGDEMDQNPLRL